MHQTEGSCRQVEGQCRQSRPGREGRHLEGLHQVKGCLPQSEGILPGRSSLKDLRRFHLRQRKSVKAIQ